MAKSIDDKLDQEWVDLINEALEIGLTVAEIKEYLAQSKDRKK